MCIAETSVGYATCFINTLFSFVSSHVSIRIITPNLECILILLWKQSRKMVRHLKSDFYCLREYFVDLIGKPGYLSDPNSLLNGPSSISISSPLRFPRLKPSESLIDIRSLAEQYFSDCQMLNITFSDATAGISGPSSLI